MINVRYQKITLSLDTNKATDFSLKIEKVCSLKNILPNFLLWQYFKLKESEIHYPQKLANQVISKLPFEFARCLMKNDQS